MHPLTRRDFLTSATVAVSAAANAVNAQTQVIPIIDTHIHLFDQTRPQGAPYTGNPGNTEPALPQTYRKLAPAGIVGAIEMGVATLEPQSRRGIAGAGPVRCGIPSRHRSLRRDRWRGVARSPLPWARSSACRSAPYDL